MKILKQFITETLKDPNYGIHQEKGLWNQQGTKYIKPDWLYTFDTNKSAIIIEDKEKNDVNLDKAIDKLNNTYYPFIKEYGYENIITIACKHDEKSGKIITKNFLNKRFIDDVLHSLNWYKDYLGVCEEDNGKPRLKNNVTEEIYSKTKQINEILHHDFRIKHLQDRMLYTGCLLVASKWSDGKMQDFEDIKKLKNFVCESIDKGKFDNNIEIRNSKLNELKRLFNSISIGTKPNSAIIHVICEKCNEIIKIYENSPLCEIDIMNIFFIEFNRYRGKSEHGQVFTPDHIAGLMADLLDIKPNDNILDPCCGGGGLLIACSNKNGKKFKNIFGNDDDNNVLRLAYINMLLHNDGVTNLKQMDATFSDLDGENNNNTHSFAQWVKNTNINKVIANPPYEGSKAIDILKNILDNVVPNSKIVWLMPNTKMEKIKKSRKILLNNTLTDIIFLGSKIFPKTGCGDVSLFVFESGEPQNNRKIKCWSINDGFKTVKNQGYQDVNSNWPSIRRKFLEAYKSNKYDKEIDPSEQLSYPKKFESTNITKEDFEITLLQYMLYKQGRISSQNTINSTLQLLIDYVKTNNHNDKLRFFKKIIEKENNELKHITWKKIPLKYIFKIKKCLGTKIGNLIDGEIPYVSRTSINNGTIRMCGNKDLLNPKNTITIHAEWKQNYCAFYQEKNYVTDGMIAFLSCAKLNKYNALFITTILSKTKYSGKGLKESLNNLLIKLPIARNGDIAWDYMEKYIKEKLN